jgi:hypothetical protein
VSSFWTASSSSTSRMVEESGIVYQSACPRRVLASLL